MIKLLLRTVLLLAVVSSFLVAIPTSLPAHAVRVGIVCIAPTGLTQCPADPQVLIQAPSTTQLSVAVMINSSDAFSGFDIIIRANSSILRPFDANVVGSVLPGPTSTIVKCIGGAVKIGTQCTSQASSPDAIEMAVSACTSCFTTPPTTGLLFTAIYDIVGSTTNTPVGFQTGCSSSSTLGFCDAISTGAQAFNSETIQNAQFSNQAYYSIDADPVSVSITSASPGTSSLTITSLNTFAGTVALTATGSVPGLTGSFPSPPGSSLKVSTANPQNSTTLSVSADSSVLGGIYNLNVSATSGTLKNFVVLKITVMAPNFSISATPSNITVNASSTGSAAGNFTLDLSSLFGFTGSVSLTPSYPVGFVTILSRPVIQLTAGGTNSSLLTVKSNGTGTVTISAKSGTITQTVQVTLTVRDFTVTITPQTLTIDQNTTKTAKVTIGTPAANIGANFAGTVNVTLLVSMTSSGNSQSGTSGLSVSCTLQSLVVKSASGTNSTSCNISGAIPGTYSLIVTGKSRLFPDHAAAADIQVQGPDFAIIPDNAVKTVTLGSNATITLTIQDILGLKANVTLTATVTGPVPLLSASNVVLAGSANGTVILTVTTSQNLAAGPYTVSISGSATIAAQTTTHVTSVLVVITGLTHPPELILYTVRVAPNSANAGDSVNFFVQVLNNGTTTETSSVEALVGDTVVASKNVTIAPSVIANVTLTWNTSNYTPGPYILGAKVLAVPGQVNTGNNIQRVTTPFNLNAPNTAFLPVQSEEIIAALAAAIITVAGLAIYLRARRRRAV